MINSPSFDQLPDDDDDDERVSLCKSFGPVELSSTKAEAIYDVEIAYRATIYIATTVTLLIFILR